MRRRTKRNVFFVWTLLTTVLVIAVFIYDVSLPTTYCVQQKTECVLVSERENAKGRVGSSRFPIQSTTVTSNGLSMRPLALETRQNYVVIPNYIIADREYDREQTMTLTTQGTYEFLHHAEELCRRWNAPLSIAVYSPGSDFDLSVDYVIRMRQCNDPCIRANITWHFIYDINYPPTKIWLFLDGDKIIDCDANLNDIVSYRKEHRLTYPINVARNVARLQARTHYVFASDIELLPSYNVVPKFMKFIKRKGEHRKRNVYVLPVFEVAKGENPPSKKRELASMMKKGKATFFHRYVCDICHRFPGRWDWLKFLPREDHLRVFNVTKRKGSWEPFYIGTNEEPLFDERFTWEGKRNKMPQAYEMCLQEYDFSILDNAFLVHSPGIKRLSQAAERWRGSYAAKNEAAFRALRSELRQKYKNISSC